MPANPPVWGDQSFNDGAGLANVTQLASWLKVAMPFDETNLTDEEALEIAAFVDSHKRPVFLLGDHLPDKAGLGEYNSKVDRQLVKITKCPSHLSIHESIAVFRSNSKLIALSAN